MLALDESVLFASVTLFIDSCALYESELSTFRLTLPNISLITISKDISTLVESRAEVSMKKRPSSSARAFPSSLGISLMLSRSHLFPTSIRATVVSQ